jgi:4-carboxymuconolactone decarboxylase
MKHPSPGRRAQTTCAERYERGIDVLRRIGGPDWDIQLKAAAATVPDLAWLTVEFGYGDVIARDGLDLPLRQVVTVSALLAHRNAERQLAYHMAGYLNVGGDPRVLLELLYVAIVIVGFPVAIHALPLVRTLFRERGLSAMRIAPATDDGRRRAQCGRHALASVIDDPEALVGEWSTLSPQFAQWALEFEHGEILSRESLDARTRQLAIVVMLAVCGNRAVPLERHVNAALRVGITRDELTEALMQVALYAGFPTALNAIAVATAAFARGEERSSARARDASERPGEPRDARVARGLATLARTSAGAGESVVASFDDLAPDIGRAIVEHAYGEVFAGSGIDLRTRELTACAAFAAAGNQVMNTPLRVHVQAALTAGATRREIEEVLLNLVPHCGYPAVESALRVAAEVFAATGT